MKCICLESHTGPKSDKSSRNRRYKDGVVYDIPRAQYENYKDFFVPGVPEREEVVQSVSLRDAGEIGMIKSYEELKDFRVMDLLEFAASVNVNIPANTRKDDIIALLKPHFKK